MLKSTVHFIVVFYQQQTEKGVTSSPSAVSGDNNVDNGGGVGEDRCAGCASQLRDGQVSCPLIC